MQNSCPLPTLSLERLQKFDKRFCWKVSTLDLIPWLAIYVVMREERTIYIYMSIWAVDENKTKNTITN